MARSFGRIFADIWDDDDFRALSVTARLTYTFLVSQPDLEHSGIIPWRPQRWALALGLPEETVRLGLKELDHDRFTVTDEPQGELLVRALIRRDEIWKQPNVFKSAATSAKASKSARIKAALFAEIRRLELAKASRETQAIRGDLLTHLEPFANPSPTPPGASQAPPRDPIPEPVENTDPDTPDEREKRAGQNPSLTLSEPQANHSGRPTDKGNGYGPVLEEALPSSLTPSPPPPGEPFQPPMMFALPGVRPEEGDQVREGQTRDIRALIAEIRAIRPDWSTDSIRRAITCEEVTERPWPLVRAAMLAVARDPKSQHAGRLKHDGPWWSAAKPAATRAVAADVPTHQYKPAAGGRCECGLPKDNRHHAKEAS